MLNFKPKLQKMIGVDDHDAPMDKSSLITPPESPCSVVLVSLTKLLLMDSGSE